MNRTHIIILIGVLCALAAAAMLRIKGIPDQGMIFQGEVVAFARAEALQLHLFEQEPGISKTHGRADSKALWLVFLTIGHSIVDGGEHWPNVLSAVFGILTVILTYFFAKRYFGTMDVAFLSALLLSLSSYHVFYSRLAFPETASGFFYLLSLYIYICDSGKTFRGRAIVSALLAGVTLLIGGYRAMTLPLVILMLELFSPDKEQTDTRTSLRKFGLFLSVAVFAVVSYQILHSILAFNGIYIPSYFSGLKEGLAQHSWTMPELYSWLSFPLFIYEYEGPLICVFLLGGVHYYFKDRRIQLPLFVVVLGVLVSSIPNEKVAGNFVVFLPFTAMVAARSFLNLRESLGGLRICRILLTMVLLGILMTGYSKSKILTGMRTGTQTTVNHIVKLLDNSDFATFSPTAGLYSEKARRILSSEPGFYDMYQLYLEGNDYVMIDPYARLAGELYFDYGVTDEIKQFVETVDQVCVPAYTDPGFSPELIRRFIYEHNRDLKKTRAWLKQVNVNFGTIKLYSINECMKIIHYNAMNEEPQ